MQSMMRQFLLLTVVMANPIKSSTIEKSNSDGAINATSPNLLTEIFVAYFRFHGVRSLTFISCHEDLIATNDRNNLRMLLENLIVFDFYVHKMDVLGSNLIPPFIHSSDNATRRHLPLNLKRLAHKSGIIMLNFASSCAQNVLKWSATPDHNYFTTNRFWLLLTNNSADLEYLEDNEIFFPPDGEVRIMLYGDNAGIRLFSLIDVYKVSADKKLKQRFVGTSIVNGGNITRALQQFGSAISDRHNLEGITLKTGLVIAFPDLFTSIEDLSMRHIDTISKVNNRLTIELANKLNIRVNTHQTDNYGWRQPNGSFDGLMGRFQRNELDYGQLAIFMRLDRLALVDFVAETYRIRAGIIFRQPPLSAVANIFAMPFNREVWIAILILMIFIIAVLSVELWFSPHNLEMNFWDCVGLVWGAMCQQGFSVAVHNRSARITVFTTFVATLFLFTSFSANIVALLQSPSEAIRSLSDLSQSPLEIGVQDTVYNKIYFNESTDPVTNRLYHKKIAPKGDSIYMRPFIGMEKMRTGLFAYQVELQAGYQIISDTFSEPEKCGLKELEPFQLPMIAIPTRKNFPYKELFRRQLRWQREVGLINRESLKWFPPKPKCEGGVGGFVSIGLTECRYALAMFGFGILLSATVFCLELILNYFKNNCLKKQRLITSAIYREI